MLPLEPSTEPAQLTLLHTWSDPLAHAHRDWCTAWPDALLVHAARVPAAKRPLTRALRAAVPLPPLSSLDGERAVPWAVGSRRDMFRTGDEAGWLLMRSWIARAVARRDVQSMIDFLGRERYQASLQPGPDFWLRSKAAPNPGYTLPAAQLQHVFRSVGFHALNRALAGRLEAFRGRMRLLAGAQAASPEMARELPIDHDSLLAHLRDDVEPIA
jgi:hypothetical protein